MILIRAAKISQNTEPVRIYMFFFVY